MDRALGERLRVIRLFDAYGALLTERQRTLLRLYYHRDLSLGEIAVQLKITRQAVFDSLHRSMAELQRLESMLRIVGRAERTARQHQEIAGRAAALREAIDGLRGRLDRETVNRLQGTVAALRRTAGEE
ncbi:MAG TPA: sigma factor-like helix-turn-helix DNA-binding protein [bacterium]|jgi:hypothetical protein